MDREVVVVGAGPSGSTSAIALAQKGHDVLLLDRQAFPRDKTCGDGIPVSAVAILYELGMREKINDAGYYKIDKLLISSPRGYTLVANMRQGINGAASYVVTRFEFDALVQQHAVDCGAEFKQARVKEPIIEDGFVRGVRAIVNGAEEEIRAKVVIGADGVTSALARSLRPDKHEDKHRAVALRAYIQDIEVQPRMVEFYLYKGILPGYAWIFPLGDESANLGIGMRLDKFRQHKGDLEQMVHTFLEMSAIKQRLKRGGVLQDIAVWQLNFGSQPMQRAYDGAVLIGDAAGLINPLTGGGISNGVQSAIMAADVIHQALSKGDTSIKMLQAYDQGIEARVRKGMRRSFMIQRAMIGVPLWMDILVRWGGSNSEMAQTFVEKL